MAIRQLQHFHSDKLFAMTDSNGNGSSSLSTGQKIGPEILVGLCLILLAFQYAAIFFSFPPSFEDSLIEGYRLPLLGLKLCSLCKSLKYNFWKDRIQHYDDFQGLQESALLGCWCCRTVCEQLAISIEDFNSPPVVANPDDLKVPHLLMWFAENTSTKSRYLDHLRKVGMCPPILLT